MKSKSANIVNAEAWASAVVWLNKMIIRRRCARARARAATHQYAIYCCYQTAIKDKSITRWLRVRLGGRWASQRECGSSIPHFMQQWSDSVVPEDMTLRVYFSQAFPFTSHFRVGDDSNFVILKLPIPIEWATARWIRLYEFLNANKVLINTLYGSLVILFACKIGLAARVRLIRNGWPLLTSPYR